MARAKISFEDEVVIYHSKEDDRWVAHSLRTDQIGAGDRIVDALAALIRGVGELCKLAAQDQTIAYLREAPAQIQQIHRKAKTLPGEIFEVAHKMVICKRFDGPSESRPTRF